MRRCFARTDWFVWNGAFFYRDYSDLKSTEQIFMAIIPTERGNGMARITNEGVQTVNSYQPSHLHGRRQIFTNETAITRDNVIKVLAKSLETHWLNREEIIYLEKYLRGKQPILDRVKKYHDEINNKIVINIANEIVTFKTSEFAGEPIQYKSRASESDDVPEKVAKINDMMLSEGKQTKDIELAHDMFTCGVGYRLVMHDRGRSKAEYLDEAPFEFYIPEPMNTFVVRLNDVTRRVVMGVTYVWQDDIENNIIYTVYTDNVTYTIQGGMAGAYKILSEKRHNFGMVTLIEYPCNPLRMGAFEVVLPILDAINLTQSNRLDGVEQFIQAIMVFEGVDITREDLLALKDMGAIKLPPSMDGRNSRVYYLNEQLDQAQTQTLVDDMYQTVLQIVGMPSQGNANTSDSSNNGATIMKNGWWHAEARSLETQGMWKMSETEFLKVVLKICSETNTLGGIRISDLEPVFWRQSYEDLLVKTQSFSTLRAAGAPAIQAFTYSHLSKDPESDAMMYDAYQEEQAAALDALAGASEGGNSAASTLNAEGNLRHGNISGTGHPRNATGVCPVCGRQFKKRTNNQVYDRPECREKANKRGEGQTAESVSGDQ